MILVSGFGVISECREAGVDGLERFWTLLDGISDILGRGERCWRDLRLWRGRCGRLGAVLERFWTAFWVGASGAGEISVCGEAGEDGLERF